MKSFVSCHSVMLARFVEKAVFGSVVLVGATSQQQCWWERRHSIFWLSWAITHSSLVVHSVLVGAIYFVVAAMFVLALVVHGTERPLCRKEYFLRDTRFYEIIMISVAHIGGKELRAL